MAASEPCARPKPAFVYMVRCTGGTLYTGWTTDPAARLRAHQSGRGAKYTRARGAGGFAYLELCADKRAALRREYALKQLPKAQKELLCAAWTAGRALCRRIRPKRNPGLFQGQTAHKRIPGFLFLRCEFFPCAVVRTCLRTGCMCPEYILCKCIKYEYILQITHKDAT